MHNQCFVVFSPFQKLKYLVLIVRDNNVYHASDGAADGVLFAGGGHSAVSVDVADGELDGSVVLGVDDAVAGRTGFEKEAD